GSPDLDRVVLDDRVGEELPAHLLDPRSGGRRIGVGKVELDQFALADLADIGEAEPFQRIADRLALRVEDPRLQADMDACLHAASPGLPPTPPPRAPRPPPPPPPPPPARGGGGGG